MKKSINELEKKLKEITGEDKLPRGEISDSKKTSVFNKSRFLKLAEEVRKILIEDAKNPNPAIKS